MGPYSPSCESSTSDQTHMPSPPAASTPVEDRGQHDAREPVPHGLNFMLERSVPQPTWASKTDACCCRAKRFTCTHPRG